ncbi:MAG: GNAT family N-acetyltransferase [Pseudomonadales bacterium]|jgi:ribosomal protein S18 acetylase RimI-like enzyme|nr:GNAT family N-acetyltransferase [Pseudomonadales bacterium]
MKKSPIQNLRIIVPDTSYATPISALIMSLMDAFIEPGADTSEFRRSVSPKAEAEYLNDTRYWYRVALIDGAFAGVISLRDHTHLTHLFIAPNLQRRGIGCALWETALEYLRQVHAQVVTVKAAPEAISFYE